MPRYYFDIHHGDVWSLDRTGVDARDDDMAATLAFDALPDILRDDLVAGRRGELVIRVRRADGSVVLTARLHLHVAWDPCPAS